MSHDAKGPAPSGPSVRRRRIVAFVVSAVVFAVLDAIWLTTGSGTLYDDRIGHLLADRPNLVAAVAFYVVYLVGFFHFVLRPAITIGSVPRGVRDAAAFGVVTYATFDLTSMAVFRDFPLLVVLVDIAWGAVLCAVTAAVALAVAFRTPNDQ